MPQPKAADGTTLVATRKLRLGQTQFLRTDDGSDNMAIDGSAAGTILNVWNGSGDAGADATVTGQGSEQAAAARPPSTNGWDTGVVNAGTETKFDKGTDSDIGATYSELDFWFNTQAKPIGAKALVGFENAASAEVSNYLNVAEYVNGFEFGTWQRVKIPIADFTFTGNGSAVKFKWEDVNGQHHYLDDIKLNEPGGGGPYRFRAIGKVGEDWHVTRVVLLISDESGGWASNTFASLVAALEAGVLLRHKNISTKEVLFLINVLDNSDLFGRYHEVVDTAFSNTVRLATVTLKPTAGSVILNQDCALDFVIRDDLTALVKMRAFVHYDIEVTT